MPTGATIVSGALSGLQHVLDDHGVEPCALGRSSGIPEDAWRDRRVEIPLSSFVSIYERGAEALHQPGVGWTCGRKFDIADLGAFGEAVLTAPTIGDALTIFADFISAVQSETELRLTVDGGQATLSYRILNPDIWPRRQDAEFTLSVLKSLIETAAGDDWHPDFISFEHDAVRSVTAWQEATGSDCLFGCETNALGFPESVLGCPMPQTDGSRHRLSVETLARRMAEITRSTSLTERTRLAIYSHLGSEAVDQETIAAILGLSRRSLHRHLSDEGTRYSAVLEDCRFRVARQALVCSGHPLAEIAFDLSYSDQTAFERAFKRRTGLTPRHYRRLFRRDAAA
ncbi:AraC family transcriptional regulator ligand-binding domain-containing protein [Amorphus sp. 3PC139-8]|uniref:AraC-like transcriptional regulator QhpR n=1 Tax=Amorphus sp. 3PC139-8 TaxID=2735676 RepID=UPI00345C64A4